MAEEIPLALDNTGAKVLPKEKLKDKGPFTCVDCAKPLFIVKGDSGQRCHFRHVKAIAHDCSASLTILTAQFIIVKYFASINFVHGSIRGDGTQKQYTGCTPVPSSRGVDVFEDGGLKTIIAIQHSGRLIGDVRDRVSSVEAENLWKVCANVIIDSRYRMDSTEGTFDLSAHNEQCMIEWGASPEWQEFKRVLQPGTCHHQSARESQHQSMGHIRKSELAYARTVEKSFDDTYEPSGEGGGGVKRVHIDFARAETIRIIRFFLFFVSKNCAADIPHVGVGRVPSPHHKRGKWGRYPDLTLISHLLTSHLPQQKTPMVARVFPINYSRFPFF